MEKLINGARRLGLLLTPEQIESFEIYYQELLSWNQKVNLTAVTDYKEAQVKHFLDSLSLVSALDLSQISNCIDIGSGAGFPGLPLKIVFPKLKLVLLDSVAKKTVFLSHLLGRLELTDVKVLTARAEDMAKALENSEKNLREKFDLVVSRAAAKLPTVVELALPFCHIGGYFVYFQQGKENLVTSASEAIGVLGGELVEIKPVNLPELERHFLVIIRKVSPTPSIYPRRPGIPKKRPLVGKFSSVG
jgi:16S rRNA (guanine527-N7)-methyltransferase